MKQRYRFFLATFVLFIRAYTIQMPDAQVLRNNLQAAGLVNFDIQTGIVTFLAGKDVTVEDVVQKVSEGLDPYALEGMKSLQEDGAVPAALSRHYNQVHEYAPYIASVLLKGNTQASAALKKMGILKSNL